MRNRLRLFVMFLGVMLVSQVSMAAELIEEGEEAKTAVIGPWWAGMVPAVLTIVIFVLLLVVLSKYAWGPIAKGLKDREDKIRKDIEQAETARAQAEATMRQYQSQLAGAEANVRQLLEQAKADGEKLATSIRVRAQEEAEQIKEKAQREIDGARQAALRDIYEQAAVLSTNIAEKILRRNLNVDDQRELVNSSLSQLEALHQA